MNVLLMTWGSRGDVQPYLALARGLMSGGHDLRAIGPAVDEFTDLARAVGVPYLPMGPAFSGASVSAFMDRVVKVPDPILQTRSLINTFVVPALEEVYHASLEHARWADVVVSHFFQPAGRMAAEHMGRPWVSATLTHLAFGSRAYPPTPLPDLGAFINRALWDLGLRYASLLWSGGINAVRRRVGLPSLHRLAERDFYSPGLNLVGVSRHVAPPQPDWPPGTRVTGYWFLGRPNWAPPPELVGFVGQEPPPIAIGFGSMATDDGPAVTRLLVEATRRARVRAVLQAGWAGLGAGTLPPTILPVGDVPHSWLFDRVTAVVHHGGAGTTAAAIRAGVPSVFVPHISDQRAWAATVRHLGVAPPSVPRRTLSAGALARAIRAALDPGMRARAKRLGTAVRAEDGVGTAVRLIEEYVASGRAPG
ncbi:MAG: glycosyltransferase family 1 protein [Chloroflexi bacterium]|nr:glycosyltransferase family 1 protein [Chloroflexota bacterium]